MARAGGASEQLLTLCRHILSQESTPNDAQSSKQMEDRVKDIFRTSVKLLSKSQSSQEDATINEFSVAEKIKKYLVIYDYTFNVKQKYTWACWFPTAHVLGISVKKKECVLALLQDVGSYWVLERILALLGEGTPIRHSNLQRESAIVRIYVILLMFKVRDGREKDTATFSELHIRLQRSTIIKHRDAILSLFLNLAEKTAKYVYTLNKI